MVEDGHRVAHPLNVIEDMGGIKNGGSATPTTYFGPTVLGGVKLYGVAFEYAVGTLVLRGDIETEPRYTADITSEPRYTCELESEPRYTSEITSEPRWSSDIESEPRFTASVSVQ